MSAVPTFTARNSPREVTPPSHELWLRYQLRALQQQLEHIEAALPGMRTPVFIEKAQRSRTTAIARIAALQAELSTVSHTE